MIEETRKGTWFVLAMDAVSAQAYLTAHLHAPDRETDWVFPDAETARRAGTGSWRETHHVYEVTLEVKTCM